MIRSMGAAERKTSMGFFQRAWLLLLLALAGCRCAALRDDVEPPTHSLSSLIGPAAERTTAPQRQATNPDESVGNTLVPGTQTAVVPASFVENQTEFSTLLPPVASGDEADKMSREPPLPDAWTARKDGPAVLTLEQALATGLLANPDLVTMRGQENVSQAAVGVAKTYPWNPFVQSQYFPNGRPFIPGPPGITAAGQSNFYVWAMQRFELAHQRQLRTQSALAALTQVQWNIYQAELLNLAQSMRVYLAALYQKELHDLAQETAALNGRLTDVVERRYKANLAKAAEVTAARIAARQSRRQAELAEATYKASLLAVRQQLNIPLTRSVILKDKLTELHWSRVELRAGERSDVGRIANPSHNPDGDPSNDVQALAADLVEGRPDVMAAQAGMKVSEANYRLSRAAQVPDLQAGPIYETADDGTKYLGFRLQMEMPVWNNGAPLARQRRAELTQQQLTYEQLKVRAALEAQTAIDRYERARGLVDKAAVDHARSAALPAELKEIMAQFQAGQADIIAVLTTQGNLLQERRVYLDMLNELGQSAAAVVQATALPPQRLVDLGTVEPNPDNPR